MPRPISQNDALDCLCGPVRDWFERTFPGGPTPAQGLAWPAIAAGENVLLVSPTGTGKTLAAFLAILDRLHREHAGRDARAGPAVRLRLAAAEPRLRHRAEPVGAARGDPPRARPRRRARSRVGVRTGDTSAHDRRKLRDEPPHLLITTPESLSLLLSQPAWHEHWRGGRASDRRRGPRPGRRPSGAPTWPSRSNGSRRGRRRDPSRVGLSATCRPGRAGRAVPRRAVADLPGRRGPDARRDRRR